MNVLFLMVDELSWWALGHVNKRVKTPNIDRLAARGQVFAEAYTPSPICVPARASIATGKYVHEIGTWSSAEAYDGSTPSWGHQLQAAGKGSVSIGKLHYKGGQYDTGFDRQIEPIHILNGVGWVQALLRRPVEPYTMAHELAEDIGPGNSSYLDFDRRVTAAAVNWLENEAPLDKGWCTFVSWFSPHYPLIAPQNFYNLYDPEDFSGEAEAAPDHPILQEIVGFFDHDPYFTPETRKIAKASYYSLCSFIDSEVGKVLAALEASGQAEDTLIIFTSDHGEMLGEKGFWTKSTMYDSAAKVPLIVAGPGIDPGRRNDPVSLIDIAPTITGALGLSGQGFSGRSLLEDPEKGRSILSEYHDGGCSAGFTMVRWNDGSKRWKYVHYAEGHPAQLFELGDDPEEHNDLSDAWPEMLAEGLRRLRRWMDPEAVNERAHADQARRMAKLGGREKLNAYPVFNFTPADSR